MMQSPKQESQIAPSVWTAVPEPDTWEPDELDLEPETCLCLRCGAELPCSCWADELFVAGDPQ